MSGARSESRINMIIGQSSPLGPPQPIRTGSADSSKRFETFESPDRAEITPETDPPRGRRGLKQTLATNGGNDRGRATPKPSRFLSASFRETSNAVEESVVRASPQISAISASEARLVADVLDDYLQSSDRDLTQLNPEGDEA